MNPYEAPEPCTDEEPSSSIYEIPLAIRAMIVLGPLALFWLVRCFKKDYPHTTFFEGVVACALFVLWHITVAITIVWIPYLLRVL